MKSRDLKNKQRKNIKIKDITLKDKQVSSCGTKKIKRLTLISSTKF